MAPHRPRRGLCTGRPSRQEQDQSGKTTEFLSDYAGAPIIPADDGGTPAVPVEENVLFRFCRGRGAATRGC